MTPRCTGGSCRQGREKCATPEACSDEVMGGTYFPKLAEARPYFALRNDHDEFCEDEPMSALVTACVIAVAIACVAAVIYSIATN